MVANILYACPPARPRIACLLCSLISLLPFLLSSLLPPSFPIACSELAALYSQEGRRLVSDSVCAELISAAADGPRASDRFAAASATAVAGLAGSVRAAEVVANFLDREGGRALIGTCLPAVCLPACLPA